MIEFHAHLDQCSQCREHPFSLCPRGEVILKTHTPEEESEDRGHSYKESSPHLMKEGKEQ